MEKALHRSVSMDGIVRCIFPRRHAAVNEQLELRTALLSLPSFPCLRVSMADRGGYDDGHDYDNKRRRDGFLQPRPIPLVRSLARYGAICSCIVARQFVPPSVKTLLNDQ